MGPPLATKDEIATAWQYLDGRHPDRGGIFELDEMMAVIERDRKPGRLWQVLERQMDEALDNYNAQLDLGNDPVGSGQHNREPPVSAVDQAVAGLEDSGSESYWWAIAAVAAAGILYFFWRRR